MKELRTRGLMVFASALLFIGCDPDIPQDDPPSGDFVKAVYDADTATLPLPNSAALEADGTLPQLPTPRGEESAENAFFQYVGNFFGWSPLQAIEVPFSGPLDETSITSDTVILYQVDGETLTQLDSTTGYAENTETTTVCLPAVCASVITVIPAAPLVPGAQYAVLVTTGVQDTNGNGVVPDSAVFFGLSNLPIYEDGEVKLGVVADDPETAQALEGIRQQLAPIKNALDIDRSDIASLFTWGVVQNSFTVLDPVAPLIPIPNTLGLESDGTFPGSALTFCGGPGFDPATTPTGCNDPAPEFVTCETADECPTDGGPLSCLGGRCLSARCAQGDFDNYLDGLHGWPDITPITLPFVGEVDPTTLNDTNVQLWANVAGTWTKVEGTSVGFDACGSQILITPPETMALNTEYVAFATRDLKSTILDLDGNPLPVLPPNELLLAMQPYDVLESNGTSCEAAAVATPCDGGGICAPFTTESGTDFACGVSTIGNVPTASAFALHAIRPLVRGTAELVEAISGLDYTELASVWSWYTWTDTFTAFDPTAGVIPFPHDVLTTGCPDDRPVCNIPQGADPLSMLLYEELSRREGFSTTSPHWVPFVGAPVDPATIEKGVENPGMPITGNVLFAEADVIPPPLIDSADWEVSFLEDNIRVDFNRPLKDDILVAGLITDSIMGSNGFPIQPQPAFVFLRTEYPLVDMDGNSLVAQLDDGTAAVLEGSRNEFDQLFLVALLFGYARSEVVNAWAFVTEPVVRPLQELRARTLAAIATDGPTVITEATPNIVADPGTVPDPDDAAVNVDVSNIEEIHWDMEFNTYWWLDQTARPTGTPVRLPAGISVFVPKIGGGCAPPFDVAIVQHGLGGWRKSLGLAMANDNAAQCIVTVAMDLALHGGRVTDSVDLHPTTRPANSGENFVSQDFAAVKNLFHQSALDLVTLTRAIEAGALDATIGGGFSTSGTIGYVGQSIGSFIGTLFITVDDLVTSAVLNVAGGNYADLLTNSDSFSPLLEPLGLMPGSFAELQVLHFIQWVGEVADPYAFAPYTVLNPKLDLTFDGADFVEGAALPSNNVIIQKVTDDATTPNTGTDATARVMGVDLSETTFPAGTPHGFLRTLDSASPTFPETQCARTQAATYLRSAFDGAPAIAESVDVCLGN